MRIMEKVHASRMPAKLALKFNGIGNSGQIRRIPFGQSTPQTACN
jgi:hypothetical protein